MARICVCYLMLQFKPLPQHLRLPPPLFALIWTIFAITIPLIPSAIMDEYSSDYLKLILR